MLIISSFFSSKNEINKESEIKKIANHYALEKTFSTSYFNHFADKLFKIYCPTLNFIKL